MTSTNQRALGNVLIWIGVLAWVPFLVLVGTSQQVSIFPFLGGHLLGVLVGGWLRKNADRLEGLDRFESQQGRRRKLISKVMIYLGVLAWAPYFYVEKVLGQDLAIGPFLAIHSAASSAARRCAPV